MCGRDARAGARSLLTSGDDGKPVCSAGRVGTREFFCVFVVLAVTANGRRTLGTHKSMTEPEDVIRKRVRAPAGDGAELSHIVR